MTITKSRQFIPVNTNLLYKEVISSLFKAIIDGNLNPGERLIEKTIAEELGLSRTPVRQAIQEMERQGIVEDIPRKGAYVVKWSKDDTIDFWRVRLILEKEAVVQATDRISRGEIDNLYSLIDKMIYSVQRDDVNNEIEFDLAFHKQLVASSRNFTLISLYNSMELRIKMFMVYEKFISPTPNSRLNYIEQHRPVVEALKNKDTILARKFIDDSITIPLNELLERMNKHSTLPFNVHKKWNSTEQ